MKTFCPEWSLNACRINVKLLCMSHSAFQDLALTYFSGFTFLMPMLQLCLILFPMCPLVLCNYAYACIPWNTSQPQFQPLGTRTWSSSLKSCVTSSIDVIPDNTSKAEMITLNFVTSWTLTLSFLSLYHPHIKAWFLSCHRYSCLLNELPK